MLTVFLTALCLQAWAGPIAHGNLIVGNYSDANGHETTPLGVDVRTLTAAVGYKSRGAAIGGPSRNVFFGDYVGGRVLEFNGTTGAWVRDYTGASLTTVWDVAVNPVDGLLYTVGVSNHTLSTIDVAHGGAPVAFNTTGTSQPRAIAFLPTGEFYVTDQVSASTARLLKFAASARTTGAGPVSTITVPGLNTPYDMIVMPNGNLMIADKGARNVVEVKVEGSAGTVVKTITTVAGTTLQVPSSLALREETGTLYIGDWTNAAGRGYIFAYDLLDPAASKKLSNQAVDTPGALAVVAVPEPTTLVMIGCGLFALALGRRNKRQ
jgi:hypothetical protein